jgi:DNA-directed RNA polymerase specialized sigma24 family protein
VGQSKRSGIRDKDRVLIDDLYPSLRRFAAVVGPAEVEPDALVQEALLWVLALNRMRRCQSSTVLNPLGETTPRLLGDEGSPAGWSS